MSGRSQTIAADAAIISSFIRRLAITRQTDDDLPRLDMVGIDQIFFLHSRHHAAIDRNRANEVYQIRSIKK